MAGDRVLRRNNSNFAVKKRKKNIALEKKTVCLELRPKLNRILVKTKKKPSLQLVAKKRASQERFVYLGVHAAPFLHN